MGSWAISLDHPIGTWALSYPVVTMTLVLVIGILVWTRPVWFAHVLEYQRQAPGNRDGSTTGVEGSATAR